MGFRRHRSDFYIMKAHHLTSSVRKLGLRKICRDEPNCTILQVTRYYNGKTVDAFIVGARGDYNVKRGDNVTYTIDTGNGYRCDGERMTVNCVIDVENGEITNLDAGTIRMIDNAYTWVMK